MGQHQPTPLENRAETPLNIVAERIIQYLQERFPDSPEQQKEALEQTLEYSKRASSVGRMQGSEIFSTIFRILSELEYPFNLFNPALQAAIVQLQAQTISATRKKVESDDHDPLNELRSSLASEFETTFPDMDEGPPTIREPEPMTQTMPSLGVPPVESAPPVSPSKFVRISENLARATALADTLVVELFTDLIADETSLTLDHALTMESPEVETHIREQAYELKPGIDEQEVSTLLYLVTIKCKSYLNSTFRQAEALIKDIEDVLAAVPRRKKKAILRVFQTKQTSEDITETLEAVAHKCDELKKIIDDRNYANIFSSGEKMDHIDSTIREYVIWHTASHMKKKPSILTALPIKGIGLMRPNYQPEPKPENESKRQPRSTPPPRRKRLKATLRGASKNPILYSRAELRAKEAKDHFESWFISNLPNKSKKDMTSPRDYEWIRRQLDAIEASCDSIDSINPFMANAISYTVKMMMQNPHTTELPLSHEQVKKSIATVRKVLLGE